MLNKACPHSYGKPCWGRYARFLLWRGTGFTVNALVPKRGYHLSFLRGVCQYVFVSCCRWRVSREAHRMQLEPFGEGPRPRGVRPSVSSWRAAAAIRDTGRRSRNWSAFRVPCEFPSNLPILVTCQRDIEKCRISAPLLHSGMSRRNGLANIHAAPIAVTFEGYVVRRKRDSAEPAYIAYSGRSRSAFRHDVDHDSGLKPISVPG